jgi:hypothetical protein
MAGISEKGSISCGVGVPDEDKAVPTFHECAVRVFRGETEDGEGVGVGFWRARCDKSGACRR